MTVIRVEPLPLRIAQPAGPAGVPAPLVVGSLVAVEALRESAQGQLLLLFAGRKWAVRPGGAAADIQPGARMLARVVRAEPDVELALPRSEPQDVASALRRELPRQGNPLRLLANLAWLANGDAGQDLPEPVRNALQAAWRAVPQSQDLAQPDGLERALRESGARLEQVLATGSRGEVEHAVARDWKSALCRLQEAAAKGGDASQVRPRTVPDDLPLPSRQGPLTAIAAEAPTLATVDDLPLLLGELAQQARESIARVACNQLASLDGRGAPSWPLVVELPFRTPAQGLGLLRLRVDRESAPGPGATSVWSVEFALDLGAPGPLRGRVTLAEGRVSVSLHPESGVLAQAIEAHVDELRAGLENAGLAVGRLRCVRSDPLDTGQTGSWLVNLRA